ncbi:uncharacterized protein LOC126748266 isoform X2 [Anthonomus grandis grandis]|uniref:uncharacterized protein LOC126748266 isoform X2 n=1 Tax=Anthonomus grandis grandis TaxID=2921223 RepID=UPI0021656484|nr:uncharacterized protein LOC126748266 isoform X2 [Anthonomus grandis grandis]
MRNSMVPLALYMLLLLYLPALPLNKAQRLAPPRSYHSEDEDDDHPILSDDEKDDYVQTNLTDERGLHVGAPCEFTCSSRLQHVYCNPVTNTCECEKKYPVKLHNPYSGCSKPKKLGEQCYYHEACEYMDQHSSCIQIHHNAICQCQNGYHSVAMQKPTKRVFCAEDIQVITKDFSTFAGVLSGIAILSGLICFVLHLFNQNLYGSGHHRHRFGNANLAPPILFSSDPGSLPLPILARSVATPSQASTRRTGSSSTRRASSVATLHRVGTGTSTVPQSRTGAARDAAILLLSYCDYVAAGESGSIVESSLGSRRPSIASIHSASSMRSYSARRYEKERAEKEEREMQRRLSKMTSASVGRLTPTPSPHSTDDLLPTLEEDKQTEPTTMGGYANTSYAL